MSDEKTGAIQILINCAVKHTLNSNHLYFQLVDYIAYPVEAALIDPLFKLSSTIIMLYVTWLKQNINLLLLQLHCCFVNKHNSHIRIIKWQMPSGSFYCA